MRGRRSLVGPLLELLTLPLAFHSLLLALALALPSFFGRWAAVAGFVALAMHLAAAVAAGNCVGRDCGPWQRRRLPGLELIQAPRISGLLGRGAAWVRTERAAGETSNA